MSAAQLLEAGDVEMSMDPEVSQEGPLFIFRGVPTDCRNTSQLHKRELYSVFLLLHFQWSPLVMHHEFGKRLFFHPILERKHSHS